MTTLEWINSADILAKDRFDYVREEIWLKRNGMDVAVSAPDQIDFQCLALALPGLHVQRVAMSAAEIFRTRSQAIQSHDSMALVSWNMGPVHIECDDSHARLQQGQAMLLASRVRSRSVMPASEFVCLSLDTERLWRLLPRPPLPGVVALETTPLFCLLTQYLAGLLHNNSPSQSLDTIEQDLVAAQVFELAAACLSRGTRDWNERFSDAMHLEHYQLARRLIEQRLAEPELTVSDIAHQLGVSLRYLQGLFQERGETCRSIIRNTRLLRAHERLQSPDWQHMSILHIALSVGFSDHSHFTKCFKHQFELSPRAVRGQM